MNIPRNKEQLAVGTNAACACGWLRPLVKVQVDIEAGEVEISVYYECPQCGRLHVCEELPRESGSDSPRKVR